MERVHAAYLQLIRHPLLVRTGPLNATIIVCSASERWGNKELMLTSLPKGSQTNCKGSEGASPGKDTKLWTPHWTVSSKMVFSSADPWGSG